MITAPVGGSWGQNWEPSPGHLAPQLRGPSLAPAPLGSPVPGSEAYGAPPWNIALGLSPQAPGPRQEQDLSPSGPWPTRSRGGSPVTGRHYGLWLQVKNQRIGRQIRPCWGFLAQSSLCGYRLTREGRQGWQRGRGCRLGAFRGRRSQGRLPDRLPSNLVQPHPSSQLRTDGAREGNKEAQQALGHSYLRAFALAVPPAQNNPPPDLWLASTLQIAAQLSSPQGSLPDSPIYKTSTLTSLFYISLIFFMALNIN